MSKYIDAEKLIKFKETLADIIVSSQGICTYQDCKDIAEREALLLIATLQQEQPSLPSNLDEAAEEYAKEQLGYCDDDPDDENLCWQPLYFAFKAGAELERQMKQEQPEVDLEEKIKDYFQGYWPGTETAEQCNTDMHFTPPAIMRLAEYFYELGKNAKEK